MDVAAQCMCPGCRTSLPPQFGLRNRARRLPGDGTGGLRQGFFATRIAGDFVWLLNGLEGNQADLGGIGVDSETLATPGPLRLSGLVQKCESGSSPAVSGIPAGQTGSYLWEVIEGRHRVRCWQLMALGQEHENDVGNDGDGQK